LFLNKEKKMKGQESQFRKRLLLVAALGFIVISAFAGGKAETPRAVREVEEFPLREKVTLTYLMPFPVTASSVMDDFNGSLTYQELEKLTNVHINWIHPAAGQETEHFNLTIASGQYPDLIFNPGRYQGGIEKGIEDGVFLQLNDYIDKYAPNYQALRKGNSQGLRESVGDSGKIGAIFALLRQENLSWWGPVIRKDWLDETGLGIPETLDDWDKLLRAFKKNHPDAAPLTFTAGGFKESGIDSYAAVLSAWNIGTGFYREGNTVKYAPIQDKTKEYLTLMATWYKDGLLDKDFPARDGTALNTLVTSGKVGAQIGDLDNLSNLWASQNVDRVAAPYPVLKKGDKVQYRAKDWVTTVGWVTAISTQCKNPEVAVKWLDYAFTDKGSMLFNFGIEGLTYTLVNGKPQYTDIVLKNPDVPISSGIYKFKMHTGTMLRWGAYSNPATLINPKNMEDKIMWTETAGYDLMLPPITLTADEGKEAANILNVTDAYKNEQLLRFIMGEISLDRYADYVSEMKKLGIDRATAIYQAAYNRFIKR
jgi:putative aldouronate transport system substrate-binding protein